MLDALSLLSLRIVDTLQSPTSTIFIQARIEAPHDQCVDCISD